MESADRMNHSGFPFSEELPRETLRPSVEGSTAKPLAPELNLSPEPAPVLPHNANAQVAPLHTSASSIYAGAIGALLSMVLMILVLPYWSNANNTPPAVCDSSDLDCPRPIAPLADSTSHTVHSRTILPSISDEKWQEVQEQNRAVLNRINAVNQELAGLSGHLTQINSLTQRIDTLDTQLSTVMEQRTHREPPFVPTAIKEVGGQPWVTVVDNYGGGTMLRHGESLEDWRVRVIDSLSGVVVFEHQHGSKHKVIL